MPSSPVELLSPDLSKAPHAPASAFRSIAAMLVTALAIRLVTMLFMVPDHLDPQRSHWRFAWEMGMVARSIATGKGFSSPFVGETGPTAWFTPTYPFLLAGVFKVFGLFTRASATVILGLNCIFSALTCIPIFLLARHTLGARIARFAGWLWVFFPYSVWIGASRIWENALTTLLLSLLLWLTLVLDAGGRFGLWIIYGMLWGLAALTNPNVLAVLPLLMLWLAWRARRRGQPWFGHAAAVPLLISVVVAPWMIRNYLVFRQFMPLRSNFWVEMRAGNTGDISDVCPDWAHPPNSAEWNRLHRLGEVGYTAEMRQTAIRFIRENPRVFLWLTWKRFVLTWTGYWSFESPYAEAEPFQIPNIFFCSILTLLALPGLLWIWRHRREWFLPFAAVLGAYPAVYYITHPSVEYRHPIDPVLVILIAATVSMFLDRRRAPAGLGSPKN